MTLGPQPYDDGTGHLLDAVLAWLAGSPATAWITFDLVEFAANTVMFVPLGILCVLWIGRPALWIAPVAGLALSGAIEGAQALWLPTRTADARDLIANTLGTVIGMLIALAARRRTTASCSS